LKKYYAEISEVIGLIHKIIDKDSMDERKLVRQVMRIG